MRRMDEPAGNADRSQTQPAVLAPPLCGSQKIESMNEERTPPIEQEHWDRITAILSMFVALCALGTSVWQGQLTMIHNRLSVTPILQAHIRTSDRPTRFEFILENNGLGPGRVLKCTYTLDGVAFDDIGVVLSKLELSKLGVHIDISDPMRVFKPGDAVPVISVTGNDKPDFDLGKAEQLLSKLRIRVDYESLYHEKHYEEMNL